MHSKHNDKGIMSSSSNTTSAGSIIKKKVVTESIKKGVNKRDSTSNVTKYKWKKVDTLKKTNKFRLLAVL